MTNINAIFRAYDIRGIYGKELTDELAEKIGVAFGNFIGEGKTVVVSRDLRRSGEKLKEKVIAGLMDAGCNIIDLGTTPTPMNYFAVNRLKADGGVSITGSHLTPEYNGFKLTKNEAIPLTDETGINWMKDLIISDKLKIAAKKGNKKIYNILNDYENFVSSKVNLERQLKIVVDTGNGTCGPFVKKIFDEMGLDAEYLFLEMEDTFPNHIPNPLIEETLGALKKRIIETKADFGIAFDGDGDRVGFVDDKGRIVSGDVAMMIFVKSLCEKRKGLKFIFDILGTKALEEYIMQLGGVLKISRIGHSFITSAVKKENSALGGEISGHFYFSDSFCYDDAIFSAAKMLDLISKQNLKMSEIIETFPKYETSPESRIPYPDELKFALINRIVENFQKKGYKVVTIDGARVEFADGWGLVRASNTEPKLVLRFEAQTKERLSEIQNEIMGEVKKEAAKDRIKI